MIVVFELECGEMVASRTLRAGEMIMVGRAEKADLAVPLDEFLSGLHFVVECRTEHAVVRDLRSTNGTLLNGKRIHYSRLNDGDEISAGRSIFKTRIYQNVEDINSKLTVPDDDAPHIGPSRFCLFGTIRQES